MALLGAMPVKFICSIGGAASGASAACGADTGTFAVGGTAPEFILFGITFCSPVGCSFLLWFFRLLSVVKPISL